MMVLPGHDFIGVGVGAVVADSAGHLFLARRGVRARNEVGCWEFPGGSLTFGEKLQNAALREFAEEFGMQIEIFGLLGVFDHILEMERQHWISVTYLARRVGGDDQPKEPEKCDGVGWYPFGNLPAPLSIITESNVDALNRGRARIGTFLEWVRRA